MRTRQFELDPRSVGAARRFTAEVLRGWPAARVETIVLMVSELATNSIRHGQTGFRLTIACRREALQIEVTDRGGGTPALQPTGPEDPAGRGLRIVDQLSDDWGVDRSLAAGKTVWFKVAAGLPDVSGHSLMIAGR
jgi:anti-sigma regulatory factor (Ser/Thr protein kinase)